MLYHLQQNWPLVHFALDQHQISPQINEPSHCALKVPFSLWHCSRISNQIRIFVLFLGQQSVRVTCSSSPAHTFSRVLARKFWWDLTWSDDSKLMGTAARHTPAPPADSCTVKGAAFRTKGKDSWSQPKNPVQIHCGLRAICAEAASRIQMKRRQETAASCWTVHHQTLWFSSVLSD